MKMLFLYLIAGCITTAGMTQQEPQRHVLPAGLSNLVGVDQFGRSFQPVAGYKPEKQVGIFYWPWIGYPFATGVYDATKIAAMPNGLKLLFDFKSLDTSISPTGQAHFWGEPIWGYYNSADEWVIRRQMKMLTMAGIDFIVFDLTNRVTYRHVYEKVLRIIEELQKEGWEAPRAVFYTHSRSLETTQELYSKLYKPGLYSSAWYKVGGKPMIIAYTNVEDDIAEAKSRNDTTYVPSKYSPEELGFFYFKRPQWPGDPVFQDGFPWIEWIFPQPLHGNTMSVSVASHPKVPMSRSLTSGWENWGRGWDPDKQKNIAEDVDRGTFFQRQWDHAIRTDPDTVFVGGWNEWVAYKQPWGDEYMLCDAANKEFSRDIEPMKGGFEDAFYLQMISNIRKYKGVAPEKTDAAKKTIDINGDLSQWNDVQPRYRNIWSREIARNSPGVTKTLVYQQPAPLNQLQEIRVAHDDRYIYFYIQAANEFVSSPETKGISVYVGLNKPERKGWEGYEYVIEQNHSGSHFQISKLNAAHTGKRVGKAEFTRMKNVIQVRIPRKTLRAGSNTGNIYFKVTDGISQPQDIMDTYVSGSAMPMGRLSYTYSLK